MYKDFNLLIVKDVRGHLLQYRIDIKELPYDLTHPAIIRMLTKFKK